QYNSTGAEMTGVGAAASRKDDKPKTLDPAQNRDSATIDHSGAQLGDNYNPFHNQNTLSQVSGQNYSELGPHDSLHLGLEDFKMEPLGGNKPRYEMKSMYSTYSRDSDVFGNTNAESATSPRDNKGNSPYDFLKSEPINSNAAAAAASDTAISDVSRGS